MCNDCYSASTARIHWRTKPDKLEKHAEDRRTNLSPGDVISKDQPESSTLGFIGQIIGLLRKKGIVRSTIFVDHASDLSYVFHCEKTVKAKERYAMDHGVSIKHYHADNGQGIHEIN